MEDDLRGIVHVHGVSSDSAIAEQYVSGGNVELPGMQGTDQPGPAKQTVGQRTAAVRTRCLNGENTA
jgi:hypothetical protein